MDRQHRVPSRRSFIPVLMACSLWCAGEDALPTNEEAAEYFEGIDVIDRESFQAMAAHVNGPWDAVIRLAEIALAEATRAFPRESVVSPMLARQATYSIPRGGVLDSCLSCAFAVGGTPSSKPDCRQILCTVYDDSRSPVGEEVSLSECFPILGQYDRKLQAITRARKTHESCLKQTGEDVWAHAPLVRAMTGDWRSFIPETPPPVLDVPPDRLPALCDRVLKDPAIGPNLPPRAIDLLSADPKRRERAIATVTRRYNFLVQWWLDKYFPTDPKTPCKVLECWGREYAVLDNMPLMHMSLNPSAWSVVVSRLWESACWHYEPYDTRSLSGRANRSAVEEHFPVLVWLMRHKEPSDETLLGEIARPRDALRGQLAAWMLCNTEPTHPGDSTRMSQLRLEWGRKLIDAYLAGPAELTADEKKNLETAKAHLSDMALPNEWDWLPPIPK